MPKIVVSSIHNYVNKSESLIQPILGITSDADTNFKSCFLSSKVDMYKKLGSIGFETEGLLLDKGLNLKLVPKSVCSPHHKSLRILSNGSYCFPSVDEPQSNFPTTIVKDYKLEQLTQGDTTVAIKFPIKEFKDSQYVLLSVGSYFVLVYWGKLIVNPTLAELRYQVESLQGLKDFFQSKCGFRVQDFGDYLILSKLQEFSVSYFTNIEDFALTPDENGCSDIISLCVPPILDIKTKYSRYQDDIKVVISRNLLINTYNLELVINNLVIESHTLKLTKESENTINAESGIIQIQIYQTDYTKDISGSYELKREFRGTREEQRITPDLFLGYPYVSALITKDFDSYIGIDKEPYLLGFDSNPSVPWSNNLVKHEGSCNYKEVPISSELLFLIRLREGSVLGEEYNISNVVPKIEYNGITTEYSYEILRWVYYDKAELISVIPTITSRIIHTALSNNLNSRQKVTEEIISKILETYKSWLTSLHSYKILKLEQDNQIQKVEIEVTINGFNGVLETSSIKIEIRS